ncbi:MAG: methylmalonyl-CoA mutase family protein [Xanthobacteraceae bacterium]
MTEPEKSLALGPDFPAATREEWRKLVDAALKGAPFERLVSHTYDALALTPLAARRPDARPIAGRAGAVPWQVLARIDHPTPALANAAARQELQNGATGLSLVLAGAVGDYGFGIPHQQDEIEQVLDGIDPATVIEVDNPGPFDALVTAPPGKNALTGARIGQDPLGIMAVAGGAARHWADLAPRFAARLGSMSAYGYRGRIAVADGRIIHNSGGSEAQELAFALAVALAYLRAMEAEGVPLEAARRMIFFRLTADADQLLTVAKFRAMRKSWGRVEASCGLTPEPAFISAETAWRTVTQRDPHVNILRATLATFAAAVGGADAITVLPFTAALGLPDDFARRVARNTQLILLEESHLDKVADPIAGAGAAEDLTDQLCRTAWNLFQEIESASGAAAALESGLLQSKVAAVRAKRADSVARLEDVLTGTSIFPDLHEAPGAQPNSPRPLARPLAHPLGIRQTAGTAGERGREGVSFAPLPPLRLAQPFEALRDASDRTLAQTGARPKVFLARLGTPAEFTARATFAQTFFAAGGIEALTDEAADAHTIASAFAASGVALACICGTDGAYDRQAVAMAAALKAAGARHIYLAGRPGANEAAVRDAGVGTFIYNGCDALAVLEAAHNLTAA